MPSYMNYAGGVTKVTNRSQDVAPAYKLSKSVIISSNTTRHIVNDISRFTDGITSATDNEFVLSGSGQLPILGFGNALVHGSNGTQFILLNAAYCPEMPTTVVSLSKFKMSGIFWSSETGSLFNRNGRGEEVLIADCKEIDGLWVLEYCQMPLQPKDKSDSEWLKDAGYSGKRGLKNFMMAYGLKLPMDYDEGKRYIEKLRGADQDAWEAAYAGRTENEH